MNVNRNGLDHNANRYVPVLDAEFEHQPCLLNDYLFDCAFERDDTILLTLSYRSTYHKVYSNKRQEKLRVVCENAPRRIEGPAKG